MGKIKKERFINKPLLSLEIIIFAAIFIKLVIFYFCASSNLIYPELMIAGLSTLAVLIFIYGLASFSKKATKPLLILVDTCITVVIITDLVFFRYFHNLPSVSLVTVFGQASEVMPAIKTLFRPFDVIFIADFLLFIFLKSRKIIFTDPKINPKKGLTIMLIGIIGLLALGTFDSSKLRNYAMKGYDNQLIFQRYGPLGFHLVDLYRTTKKWGQRLSASDREKIILEAKSHQKNLSPNQYTGLAKGKNIIMIQVESLQSFVLGQKINGQEITPNLNRFKAQSNSFENNYYVIGGGGTSDIDFTANTSLYPMQYESAFIGYGTDDFSSLPKNLNAMGYSSHAYHANNRYFWNRNVGFKSLGFQKFYAQEDYPIGEKINMGLNDKTFLNSTIEKIKTQPKPSFSYVITLSNHIPFDLPQGDKKLTINQKMDWLDENYLQSIRYTDEAIGEFIGGLKKADMFDDSMIIIYGDHTAQLPNFTLNEKYLDFKITDNNRVPLMIKLPGQKDSKNFNEVSSEIDIMPTILNLMSTNKKPLMFGRDLFSSEKPIFYAMERIDQKDIIEGNNHYKLIENCNDDCQKAKSIRDQAFDLSDKIIRYNLFKYIGL